MNMISLDFHRSNDAPLVPFFADLKAEREIIQTKSVPDIQTYCAENGLHFQLIDMPWTELRDSQTIALHQQEITECQNLSIGSNFIVRSLFLQHFDSIRKLNTVDRKDGVRGQFLVYT